MSFQNTKQEKQENINVIEKSDSPFENFIMQCCKASEPGLRKFLKKVLTRAGFSILEDSYKSERCEKDRSIESVHNLLAVRGKPNVCLVAHTDVCRDHAALREKYSNSNDHNYWMYSRHEDSENGKEIKCVQRKVDPVIKVVEHEGVVRRVIQDRDCKIQVGGDDRLGVAINTWIALNTGYDLGLFFPTDEEIGLKSSRATEMTELKDFKLMVQVDRGNNSDQLVVKISNETLCSFDTAARLLEIAYDMNSPRAPVVGAATDVYALKSRNKIREAVNMTCGYHHSYGDSANEYICTDEAKSTMKYVSEIVKSYYLNPEG